MDLAPRLKPLVPQVLQLGSGVSPSSRVRTVEVLSYVGCWLLSWKRLAGKG